MQQSNFEKVFMLIGEGANGKSTFLGVMQAVLGFDNVSAESLHDLTYERFAVASLFGKMANLHPDIESSELKNTGLLKALISGDAISAEKKYLHSFKFTNKAKLFFSANQLDFQKCQQGLSYILLILYRNDPVYGPNHFPSRKKNCFCRQFNAAQEAGNRKCNFFHLVIQ